MAYDPDPNNYFHYSPALGPALAFTVLFGLATIHHLYQLLRSRSWFMIPLLVGCLMETVGYAIRAVASAQHLEHSLGPTIIQSIFILIAPPFFAASIYMFFGYIIAALKAEKHSVIRRKWLTTIFVLGDIFTLTVQGNGAPLLTNDSQDTQKIGKYIIIAGLVLQVLLFGFFVFVSGLFYKRIIRQPTAESQDASIPWRAHIFILYATSGLIMIRSIFRVVEYVQGNTGYLLTHEAFMYSLDAALMYCVVVIFSLKHPSELSNITDGRLAMGIFRAKTPATWSPGEKLADRDSGERMILAERGV